VIAIVDYGRGNLRSVQKSLSRSLGEWGDRGCGAQTSSLPSSQASFDSLRSCGTAPATPYRPTRPASASAEDAAQIPAPVVDFVVSDEAEVLRGAEALVLPGVGAFGDAMRALRETGLDELLCERAGAGVPLLGICLGMQLLFERSFEFGEHEGLGLIPGEVRRFDEGDGAGDSEGGALKVPHIGWNVAEPRAESSGAALFADVPAQSYFYFVHGYYCAPRDDTDVLATTSYGHSFASAVAHDNIYGLQFHPEKSSAAGLQLLHNFVALIESE